MLAIPAITAEEWKNTGFLDETLRAVDYLGMTPGEACDLLGAPEEVFTFRGDSEWQDNVVFYYPDHLYLFWFENRVWQLRFDERYEGETAGISMEDTREEVIDRLGKPFYSDAESIIYILPDIGVPVRMRIFFEDNKLQDVYIYRADF